MDDHPDRLSRLPPYVAIPAACELLGFGRSTLYQLAGRGVIRVVKVGGRSVVDLDHALAWMASLPAANITTGVSQPCSDGGAGKSANVS